MLEDKIRQLTLTNEDIKKKMNAIIKAFVMFYGENKRINVETKLNNPIILRMYNNDTLKDMIDDVYDAALNEKMCKFLNVDSNSLIGIDFEELYIQLQNRDENGSEIKWFTNSKTTPKDVIERYHNGEYSELDDIINTYLYVKRIVREYEEEYLTNKRYEEIINKEYDNLLQEKYEEIIPEDIRSVLGNKYNDEFLCFPSLEEAYESSKTKQSILQASLNNTRVNILREFGFNYNTYEEALKDKKVRKFIDKYSRYFKELNNAKKILSATKLVEIVSLSKNYQDNTKEFEGKEVLNEWIDDLDLYNTSQSWYIPNYYVMDDSYQLFACIVINMDRSTNCMDSDIIHELNHAYEYFVYYVNNKFVSGGGWDIDNAEMISGFRKYELISEYVNQRIAVDITNIMHNNGDFIYSLEEPPKDSSLYMYLDFLLCDFYDSFKDIIIESRSKNNGNYLFDMIGKDNFDRLNDLVNEFVSVFGIEFNVLKLLSNPQSYDINQVQYINNLINRKNVIIEDMKNRLNKRNL